MICRDCGRDLPPGAFPIARRERTGRHRYCKPCHSARCKVSLEKHHGGSRGYLMKHRYGLTEDELRMLLFVQGGLCAICLKSPARHVDHDHSSGEVRGLLCFNCNGALGRFDDEMSVLEAAIAYLLSHGATGT